MKIAVVGSGISGLVAAHVLQRHHDVVLFEANDYLGGHTHTVTANVPEGTWQIDTGFIVFNDWTYPNFIGLLQELGVRSVPSSMGFSVRCSRCGLEYAGTTLATLFAQRRNLLSPRHYRMIYDILRFNREALRYFDQVSDTLTLGEFLSHYGYSDTFAEHYLLPMGAAIWSCPMTTFQQFPVRFIVEFYKNHGLLNVVDRPIWHVVEGGSQRYVAEISRRFQGETRLNCPVTCLSRLVDGVQVQTHRGSEDFDEVIVACHSDQALRMVSDLRPLERSVLAAFPYGENEAVLHTDVSLLPQRRSAWSSWNYHVRDRESRPSVTYNMNILQGISAPRVFCVTLNETESIDPAQVLGTYRYAHPIFTSERGAAQRRHHELIRHERISYCGAYWGNGFHEDGVVSALKVCAAFGVQPEWSQLNAHSVDTAEVRIG